MSTVHFSRENIKLYFVMGSQDCLGDPSKVLLEAIQGGITCFQFREKGRNAKTGNEKKALALQLQAICKQYQIPFIVNDDVELAMEIDADGIHIGQEDEDAYNVRQKIGSKLLGISTHNVEEAKEAVRQGADYIGVGPMYHTSTKLDIQQVQGPSVIQKIRNAGVDLPLVGIGGVNLERIHHVMESGADGVAVISAISRHNQPENAAKELLLKIKGELNLHLDL